MHFTMCALLTSTFNLIFHYDDNLCIMNFSIMQTHAAFMFIIGGLLTVKVLQSRHPGINALAYVAFSVSV